MHSPPTACADTLSCWTYVANCNNQSLVPCSGKIQNPDLQYGHDKIAVAVQQHVLSQFSTTNEEIVELPLDEESETNVMHKATTVMMMYHIQMYPNSWNTIP